MNLCYTSLSTAIAYNADAVKTVSVTANVTIFYAVSSQSIVATRKMWIPTNAFSMLLM